jgi:hypothetical protein
LKREVLNTAFGSFGASAVLIYGAVRSPLAQPRNLIGGHIISAVIGVTTYKLLPAQFLRGLCPNPLVSMRRHHFFYPTVARTPILMISVTCTDCIYWHHSACPYSHLFNYYNVVFFGKFLTMITTSSKYIEKFLTKRLVLLGSGTLNLISF